MGVTSPRLRGEVGLHRRCDPGEGVPVYQLASASRIEPLTPTLSPRRAGRGRGAPPWRRRWCHLAPLAGGGRIASTDAIRVRGTHRAFGIRGGSPSPPPPPPQARGEGEGHRPPPTKPIPT